MTTSMASAQNVTTGVPPFFGNPHIDVHMEKYGSMYSNPYWKIEDLCTFIRVSSNMLEE